MTPTQRAAPRDQHRMWCLGRRLDAHVVEIPRRPQRRRRRRKLPVLDTVVTRPCRVHLCVPRGGARHRARRCRGSTSPSSPPPPRHRHLPAQVRCRCRLRTAGCRPGFVCSAGLGAPRPPFARRPPLARRESPDGRDCCDLCAVIGCCVTVSFFEMSYQVCPRLSMRETHSLTHVHKRVSAELVKHAPSGAPEPLICCRCTEAAPRHDIARRSRVPGAHARALVGVGSGDGGDGGDRWRHARRPARA